MATNTGDSGTHTGTLNPNYPSSGDNNGYTKGSDYAVASNRNEHLTSELGSEAALKR